MWACLSACADVVGKGSLKGECAVCFTRASRESTRRGVRTKMATGGKLQRAREMQFRRVPMYYPPGIYVDTRCSFHRACVCDTMG